ncbi:MAG: hypothetical protein P4L31_08045 [Candidatus Babeliales bacterium]|nr:hypothetical protein [Candidatus Babeliales bacterium]
MHYFFIMRLILITIVFHIGSSTASIASLEKLYNPVTNKTVILIGSNQERNGQTGMDTCDELLLAAKKYQPIVILETCDGIKNALTCLFSYECQENKIVARTVGSHSNLQSLRNFFMKFSDDKLSMNDVKKICQNDNMKDLIYILSLEVVRDIENSFIDAFQYALLLLKKNNPSNAVFIRIFKAIYAQREKLYGNISEFALYEEEDKDKHMDNIVNHVLTNILIEQGGIVVFKQNNLFDLFDEAYDFALFANLIKEIHKNIEKPIVFVCGSLKKMKFFSEELLQDIGYESIQKNIESTFDVKVFFQNCTTLSQYKIQNKTD